jgi:hypothetical protein
MTKSLEEAHRREIRSIAEQALEWRQILQSAGPEEEAAFWVWIKQSPLHLREALLAEAFDEAFGRMDPAKKLPIEKLIEEAKTGSNVVPLK